MEVPKGSKSVQIIRFQVSRVVYDPSYHPASSLGRDLKFESSYRGQEVVSKRLIFLFLKFIWCGGGVSPNFYNVLLVGGKIILRRHTWGSDSCILNLK